jgi:2-methylcitrate dehydratase PrpD
MTLSGQLADWATGLDLDDVPPRVVEFAKSQVLSQLAALRAGLSHPIGAAVTKAFGDPLQPDVKQAACVLAALGTWLHFDDTVYAGHLSHSCVNVPLSYGRSLGLDGRSLLTAVIAANECAARVTAAATLGPLRGQGAAHQHLVGAVCGRLRCERAPAAQWVDALGLAFLMPPLPIRRAMWGSDAKVLSSSVPVRAGLDACDAAAAGLRGAPDILEHHEGFLAEFASVPLPDAIAGFGTRWHTETISFKMHPGGPGIDAAVDCAVVLRERLGGFRAEDVAEIVVDCSLYTVFVDRRSREYLDGPDSSPSSLIFSTPYIVATALLTGDVQAADFMAPRVQDRDRWLLAERVRLAHDEAMTRDTFVGTAPFGEALRQAGDRATPWLTEFGGPELVALVGDLGAPSADFRAADKLTGARVTVRMRDGRVFVDERDRPVGAAGPATRAAHPELVAAKFRATGGDPAVAEAVAALDTLPAGELSGLLSAALAP